MQYYITCMKKYATFDGRASRSEYWFFVLFNFIFSFAAQIVDGVLFGFTVLGAIYSLAMFIPSLAVTARRLHDTGRSGWMMLLSLIPLVGAIVVLVFLIQDSNAAGEKYGPSPKPVA